MNESEQVTVPPTPKQRTPRMSAEKSLPQSSAETLVRIIKGYAIASGGGQTPINYKDVASVSGIAPTVVSGNNKFLLESQILISPKFGYYVPSEEAVRFAREAAWDEPAAKAHLRKVVVSTWYGQTALQNLMLRPSLRRDELKRALAIKAGATEGDSNALEFMIDFLIYTGIVTESETGILAKGEVEAVEQPATTDVAVDGVTARADIGAAPLPVVSGDIKGAGLTVHIHISSPEELTEEYAIRIREWLELVQGGSKDVSVEIQPNFSSETPLT
jgi:hypothetical protein